jgi:hypothetical protein
MKHNLYTDQQWLLITGLCNFELFLFEYEYELIKIKIDYKTLMYYNFTSIYL